MAINPEDLGFTPPTIFIIVVFSIMFPFCVSVLVTPQRSLKSGASSRIGRLEVARRRRRSRRSERTGFAFESLPEELQATILSFNEELSPVLFVSRRIRALAINACISLTPIRIVASSQLSSFQALLTAQPALKHQVRYLWLEQLMERDFATCTAIIQACNNLVSLACDDQVLKASIAHASRISTLRSFTLLSINTGWDSSLMTTHHGVAFLSHLTHLRIVGLSTGISVPHHGNFERLTHLSFVVNSPRARIYIDRSKEALENRERFPSLQSIILTRKRDTGPAEANLIEDNPRLIRFYLPSYWLEMKAWVESVRGRDLWYQAAVAFKS